MDKSHDDVLKTTGNNSAQSAPNAAPTPTSSIASNSARSQSASHQSQNPASANPNVAFKSDYIGQWAAKQEDPFAEQNRKAAEKKAAQEAARKKAIPYVKIGSIVAGCVAVIIVAIVIIINITKPAPLPEVTPEESATMTEEAQKIFDKYTQGINLDDAENLTEKEKEDIQKAVDEVGKYYEQQADRTEDNSVVIQLTMDEMMLYLWNNQPEAALKASERIDPNIMDTEEKISFYSLMGNIYDGFGDNTQAEYYYDLMRKASGNTYVEG